MRANLNDLNVGWFDERDGQGNVVKGWKTKCKEMGVSEDWVYPHHQVFLALLLCTICQKWGVRSL